LHFTRAEAVPPRSVITAQPDVGRLELNPAVSFVVLATDGLWDVLTDQDAVDIGLAALTARRRAGGGGVATERTARALATTLVNTALQRGSSDNVTAIVLLPQW
jgi:serine/threonine protein phosphatase PrpC